MSNLTCQDILSSPAAHIPSLSPEELRYLIRDQVMTCATSENIQPFNQLFQLVDGISEYGKFTPNGLIAQNIQRIIGLSKYRRGDEYFEKKDWYEIDNVICDVMNTMTTAKPESL